MGSTTKPITTSSSNNRINPHRRSLPVLGDSQMNGFWPLISPAPAESGGALCDYVPIAVADHYNQDARRLGTQDAHLYYQAGKMGVAIGDEEQAQAYLQQALDINPYFSIRDAADARSLLAQ